MDHNPVNKIDGDGLLAAVWFFSSGMNESHHHFGIDRYILSAVSNQFY